MSDRPSALRSTIVVSGTRAIAAALTLAQGIVSAHAFGTSYQKDAYLVAQTIPSMVATFLVGGIYWTLFAHLGGIDRREGARGMRRYLWRILMTLAIAAAPLVLAVEALPAAAVRLMAPGFAGEPAALAASLLRITLVAALGGMLFSSVSALFHSRGRFAEPALANLLPTAMTLAGLLFFVDRAGIYVLALGPLAGTAIELALLVVLLNRRLVDPPGFAPTPHDAVEMRGLLRSFWGSFLLMSFGANFGAINVAVDNAFASFLPTGSITMLGFAFVIVSNAHLLTTATVAEVLFPRLNSSVAIGPERTRDVFRVQWRHTLLVTAPIAAGALAFAPPLVRALYERGAFTPEATAGVAALLRAYAPGVVGLGFLTLFSLFLTAQKRFARIASTAAGIIALNAALDFVLIRLFGVTGIALGTSLTALTHAVVLGVVVRRSLGRLTTSGDGLFVARVASAAMIMGTAIFGFSIAWERLAGVGGSAARLGEAAAGLTCGAAVYVGLLLAFRVDEARGLLRRVAGRLRPTGMRDSA